MSLNAPQVTVTFQPSGQAVRVRQGRQLLAVIREAGLPVGYSCRGQRVCTACAVWVTGAIEGPSDEEAALLNRLGERSSTTEAELRISCFVHVEADMVVRADYW